MTTYSMLTLTCSFLGVVLCMASTLIASLSTRKRAGGISFGLYMFAGILMMVSNIVWVFVSDAAFINLGKHMWYPYPPLSISFYLHTGGYVLLLSSNIVYGTVVLPMVWAF